VNSAFWTAGEMPVGQQKGLFIAVITELVPVIHVFFASG
jgi:hypothetical protein